MDKKIIAAVAGLIILLGTGYFIINPESNSEIDSSQSEPTVSQDSQMLMDGTDDDVSQETQIGEELSSNGRYLVYSEESFEEAKDDRRILYFYANWCPTCIPVNQEFISDADQIPEDVVVFRVNYNDDETEQFEEELAEQYGVTYQHTFVQVDESGERINIWTSGGIRELLENIE